MCLKCWWTFSDFPPHSLSVFYTRQQCMRLPGSPQFGQQSSPSNFWIFASLMGQKSYFHLVCFCSYLVRCPFICWVVSLFQILEGLCIVGDQFPWVANVISQFTISLWTPLVWLGLGFVFVMQKIACVFNATKCIFLFFIFHT